MKKKLIFGIIVVVIFAAIAAVISERKKRGPIGPLPEEIVKELLEFDLNKDGQISKDELSERMQSMITRGDLNHDDILNHEELLKLAEAQSASAQSQGSNDKPKEESQNQESEK